MLHEALTFKRGPISTGPSGSCLGSWTWVLGPGVPWTVAGIFVPTVLGALLSPSSACPSSCTAPSLIELTISLSPGLLLTPANGSLHQFLTPLHFCQSDLSRRKSDHASCLLQTLPQLQGSSPDDLGLHESPRALLPLGPPLSKPWSLLLCSNHHGLLACLQMHSDFLNLWTSVWHPHTVSSGG